MAKSLNTVPLGRANTGAAFILPESNAANALTETIAQNAQMGLYNRKLQREREKEIAKSYQDNILKAQAGRLWNPEISALNNEHIKQGIEYRKQGFDIYNPDPNSPSQMDAYENYMLDRQKLLNLNEQQKAYNTNFNKRMEQYNANPDKYTPESLQAINDFVSKNKFRDILDNGMEIPNLEEVFDLNKEVISKIHPTSIRESVVDKDGTKTDQTNPNVPAIQYQVEGNFAANPRAKANIEKKIGMPITDLLRTIDRDEIRKALDDQYRTDPDKRKLLPSAGITTFEGDKYQKFLDAQADKQVQAETAYKTEVEDVTRTIAAKVNPQYAESFDFRYNAEQRAGKDQKMQEQAFSMTKERFNEWKKDIGKKEKADETRKQWIQGLQSGVPEFVSYLEQTLNKNDNSSKITYNKDGDMIVSYTPAATTLNKRPKPVKRVINLSDDPTRSYAEFNNILNEATGNVINFEDIYNKPEFEDSIYDLPGAKGGLNQKAFDFLREQYKDDLKGLVDYLIMDNMAGSQSEAMKVANDIMRGANKIIVKKPK